MKKFARKKKYDTVKFFLLKYIIFHLLKYFAAAFSFFIFLQIISKNMDYASTFFHILYICYKFWNMVLKYSKICHINLCIYYKFWNIILKYGKICLLHVSSHVYCRQRNYTIVQTGRMRFPDGLLCHHGLKSSG